MDDRRALSIRRILAVSPLVFINGATLDVALSGDSMTGAIDRGLIVVPIWIALMSIIALATRRLRAKPDTRR